MKNGWTIIIAGILLILLSPQFLYNGILMKPMLDSSGQQIVKNEQKIYVEDKIGTALHNKGYWLCLSGGVACILIGIGMNIKNKYKKV
ncbi:MAG: hypothetical protein PHO67_06390 [Candidatus Omnitrophica bacterium]|nr:hypothetical protein [Candidatus Omnitrophota bacterium]